MKDQNQVVFEYKILPQIIDTDVYGHINYLAVSVWFDRARTSLYREFAPDLRPEGIGVVILKTEVLYKKELHWTEDVLIRTMIIHIGEKSFQVRQEAWQGGICCATGTVVFSGFDFVHRTSALIPDRIREVLNRHYIEDKTV
ncbi:MAG: thioesterase family protein [Planctomycetia bacterium]|nr:thioesterase family protein [Planctomycetia bacterium]